MIYSNNAQSKHKIMIYAFSVKSCAASESTGIPVFYIYFLKIDIKYRYTCILYLQVYLYFFTQYTCILYLFFTFGDLVVLVFYPADF